jgi:hypothetical protein
MKSADFAGSINDCYAAVRARVAGGGAAMGPLTMKAQGAI